MTVPVVVPSSTKSPEENGRVMSRVKPAKTLESVFCSESENARPATESTATSEAEGMLSLSAIIRATSTQSSTREQERMKLRIARSSLERSRAFFYGLHEQLYHQERDKEYYKRCKQISKRKPTDLGGQKVLNIRHERTSFQKC